MNLECVSGLSEAFFKRTKVTPYERKIIENALEVIDRFDVRI